MHATLSIFHINIEALTLNLMYFLKVIKFTDESFVK